MTWNIQWGRGADGRVDLDRMVAQARRFADFDVLCVQEVASGFDGLPGADGCDGFAGLARRLPGFTALSGIGVDIPRADGERRRFGNMLLARFPVLQVFAHLLPWPAEPGVRSMQRCALEATLDTPLGPLRVTTTHLEYYSALQRQEQVVCLRALQHDAVAHAQAAPQGCAANPPFHYPPRGGPAILAGDFNFRPDADEYRQLTAPIDAGTPRYLDAWTIAHPDAPHPPTVGVYDKAQWPDAPFTCDFIFISEDARSLVRDVRVEGSCDASDHQPVLLELG